MYQNSILYRVQPILFTIFGVAACQNLFFVVLPLRLKEAQVDTSSIGIAMSLFSLGAVLAGLFGAKSVAKVGHIRAFCLMAALLIIVSVCHSFSNDVWLTGALRLLAGFCLITSFLTMESWLNVLSDSSNRGRIFSIYQICIAIGGGAAPFLLNIFGLSDPRLFGVISGFLCVSIIIMSISKLPIPEISERTSAMSLKKLWGYSPSGTLSCFCAGLISAVSVSLIALYAVERDISGAALPLILSSFVLGGLLTQYPTGWLADRFDKRLVAAGLMAIGVVSNLLIILDSFVALPLSLLVFLFLVSGGSGVALFPLAVTQVFDHIDLKDAIRATGTLQIILGLGGVIGPMVAGYMMEVFSAIALYYYLVAVHLIVMVFLLMRKFFIRKERLEPNAPYQVTTQPISLGTSNLDPRVEYSLANLGDPELKLLLVALGQHPKDPSVLIKTALESSRLQPTDIAMHLVLALPKHSDELMAALVSLYPEQRLDIAASLKELFILRKQRINHLVEEGLSSGATEAEAAEIRQIIDQVDETIGSL